MLSLICRRSVGVSHGSPGYLRREPIGRQIQRLSGSVPDVPPRYVSLIRGGILKALPLTGSQPPRLEKRNTLDPPLSAPINFSSSLRRFNVHPAHPRRRRRQHQRFAPTLLPSLFALYFPLFSSSRHFFLSLGRKVGGGGEGFYYPPS